MQKTNENTNVKKPFYKKWWFFVIIGVVLLSALTNSNEKDTVNTNNSQSQTETKHEEKSTFELIAGEQGEYGQMITYNKGTELEENFYAYYVPAATYTITNIGEYPCQINIYSNETHKTEEGWEEPAETFFVKLLDVDVSENITIENGQHIEITENSKIKFEQQ